MNHPHMPPCGRIRPTPLSRREMLSASGSGLGLWALAGLFGSHTAQIAAAAGSSRDDRALSATHSRAKAGQIPDPVPTHSRP